MSAQFSLFSHGIVGDSAAIQSLLQHIDVAARCDFTVLICGESGTGKELVAKAIHENSARAAKSFIPVNCGAFTETLLESELFGYERGAFTGAHEKRKGLFEAAHTGTIFLDEIGEMSPACQVKLLRVLQEGAFRPVGGRTETSVDARIIAATNRNLTQEMSSGRFRKDLFYRIAVLTIDTPALRHRSSDIPALVNHFVRAAEEKIRCPRKHTIDRDAVTILRNYGWPGNVRELRHVVERLVAMTLNEEITAETVIRAMPKASQFRPDAQIPLLVYENDSLDAFIDRSFLSLYDQLMAQTGSHSKVARLLDTDRSALYRRLERTRRRLRSRSQNRPSDRNRSALDA
ncbi:MAG TPA: sigma-54 dependent transcriptional regulator [Pyrinomonadaceae bacterium]|nr:sigma-54 dependent transcriptional regulator [Pyrinomonadaceae bacterium]